MSILLGNLRALIPPVPEVADTPEPDTYSRGRGGAADVIGVGPQARQYSPGPRVSPPPRRTRPRGPCTGQSPRDGAPPG